MLKTGTTLTIFAAIALSIVTINPPTKAQSDETNTPERTTTQPQRTTTPSEGTSTPSEETTTPSQRTTTPLEGTTTPSQRTSTPPEGTTPNQSPTQGDSNVSDTDRQFVTQAAQDSMAEVQLGQLASQRGTSNAVKQLGQTMVRDHTQANNQLREIATEKGISLPTNIGPQNQSAQERLSKLSGAEFDRQYMQQMVQNHTKGLSLYQRQAQQGEDADLKTFAAQKVPVLQEHLQLIRSMSGNTTSPNR